MTRWGRWARGVHQEMGQEFLTPPIFDIEKSFEDSTPGTPLIFILPGTDPLQQLNSFAAHKKKCHAGAAPLPVVAAN